MKSAFSLIRERAEFFCVYAQIAIANVPQTRMKRPTSAFFDSFSLNTKYEKPMDIRILNLSIGTTTLTMPFCIA